MCHFQLVVLETESLTPAVFAIYSKRNGVSSLDIGYRSRDHLVPHTHPIDGPMEQRLYL